MQVFTCKLYKYIAQNKNRSQVFSVTTTHAHAERQLCEHHSKPSLG